MPVAARRAGRGILQNGANLGVAVDADRIDPGTAYPAAALLEFLSEFLSLK